MTRTRRHDGRLRPRPRWGTRPESRPRRRCSRGREVQGAGAHWADQRQTRVPEAYERLLFDALSGNATLFLRDDELLEAWRWVDPIIKHWEEQEQRPEPYTAGSWGPAAATLLLARDGRLWDENS